jgi:CubicO group peptidase (beta-lactamase class C family)
MYALLAMGGELDGVRLVSPESIELFSKQQSIVPNIAPFALGYHLMPPELQAFGPSARAFGHAGAGGALAFADPERRLSFALLKNQMNQAAQSVARIVRVLYSCLPS